LRGSQPGLPFASCWDLIGGALEGGESHEQAAVRETLEELELVLEGQRYWGAIQGIVRIHVHGAPLDTPAEALTLLEGERVAWFRPDHAMSLPLVPYMEKLIPAFAASRLYEELRTRL
jgi:8-oxo-dGTP pyrophosphatase MutT (NUDIX family)